jgi:CDP-diacylglycerol--serine O-phosphatidyltransferase
MNAESDSPDKSPQDSRAAADGVADKVADVGAGELGKAEGSSQEPVPQTAAAVAPGSADGFEAGAAIARDGLDSLESLIEDHEEEVSENGRTVKRRGVFLLPNLLTTGALFCGFYAVVAAMRGDYETAPIAILFALVLDGLDGRVARLTNTSSKFGAEYDSLADMVSFGVAPALVMFSWALGDLGKVGWSAAFIYVACTALRLARFNAQVGVGDPNFFIGLASPAAACIMASAVWVCQDRGWVGTALPAEVAVAAAALTALVGILMVVNVPYHSFKGFDLSGRVPFVVILMIVLIFGLVTVDPPKILLLASLAYALSGPVAQLRRWRNRAA